MANTAFPKFFTHLCLSEIDFSTAVLKAVLLSSAYTYDRTDEFLTDLTGVLATATLTNVTFTEGVIDADDTLFLSVSAGNVAALAVYVDTGVAGTSPLFLFMDTGLNFGIDPTGTLVIVWANDATVKIFPIGGNEG